MNCCRIAGGLPAPRSHFGQTPNRPSRWRGQTLTIIEEIQARNFSMSPNREEMLLFILRLLNFGVPVVLVGNPLGFVGLDEFSQDINRLTENEPIHLMPAVVDDDEWRTGLGPGMWSHNVMPKVTRWSPAVCKELHACSAAFPGYVRKACDGAQLLAMESGATAVDLSHLVLYRVKSSTYAMNSDLIEGFAEKNPYKLMKFLDVPWEQYGLLWGKISLEEIAHSRDQAELTTDKNIDEEGRTAYRSVHDRIRNQAAARISQAAKKASKTASTSEAGAKTKASLAAGLQALRQKLESEKPRPDSA